MYSHKNFTFRSMIHFELLLYKLCSIGSGLLICIGSQLFLHHLLEKPIFSPFNCLCIFLTNQAVTFVWVCFWTLFHTFDSCVFTFDPYRIVLITITLE